MSTTIDRKVVEMRFDNSDFENKVKGTLSTLDKLKEKLNLSGASKGLENITDSANKFKLTGMTSAIESVRSGFSTLEVMGVTALANITNSAINAGKRIVSALTIDPIKTGFSEYETQINAVQTILANTESKGTTLQDVNRALDELNTYADKTIYNFTEMTKNIGTFTAAGIDLDTSVSAIQGIANLAAVSGSTSQQASTAMYQLSQALSTGTVKLIDWNSVVNAGMGGQVFQDALKATARVHGVAVDKIIKQEGSFRESLSEGWLTAEILTDTLNKFTMAAEEGSDEWKEYKKSLMSEGYTSKQAEEILKMANTATDAATKVKTFTQLWDTLKESAQSGWTQTWEIIIGDFGEAKEFLTSISDTIGGMLSASAEARNSLLSGGLSSGWKQLLNAGIADEEGYKETIQKVAKKNGFAFDKLIKETEEKGGTYEDALKQALTDGKITSDMLTESVSEMSNKMQKMSAKEREAAGYTVEYVEQIKKLDEGLKDGSISMEEFTKKIMRPSGRENLIEALTNAFNGLMNIVKPVKEAWREIFPAMQSEELYNITVKIKEMTAKFKEFTENYAPKIKSTFKGVFAVIDIGVTFIKDLIGGFGKLLSNLTGVTGGILGVTGALGDWLIKVRDSVKEGDYFGKTIDKIVEFLQKGIDKIKEFAGPGLKVFQGLFDFIKKIGSGIGKVLSESLREGDIVSALNVLNTGIISTILITIKKFMSNFSGSFENIGEVLESFKGILESYQQDLQAKTLLKIASAIGILAVSLLILASIKPENMAAAITAMTILFGELLGSLFFFGKVAGDIKNVMRASTAMISLSSSILILSLALKIMSTMSWKEMGVGLIAMTVALGELIGVMWAMPKDTGKINGVVKLAFSLVILGGALKILATMSWSDIGRSLTVMTVALGEFIGLTWALHKTNLSANTKGMTKLAFSLVVLGGALKLLATLSWDDIGRSLTVMTVALGEFIGLSWALHKTNLSANTKGMIKLATSLVILGGALKILATMSWDDIARSLTVMTVALGELIGLTWALKASSAGGTAVAMLGLTTSLILLGTALKIMGSMSWESIIKGLVAIAGAFILIGAAGYLLAPIVPTLLGLAGAFALFGAGTLAIGVGLGLIATGISALALAVSGGATAIVAGLTAIILGVVGLIPEIVKILGDAIVVLCGVLIECAPLIADTVLIVVDKIFASLAKYTPSIVTSLMQFLIGVLQSLRDHLPQLIVAAVEVIGAFFDGIVAALKGIDPSSLLQGVLGLTLLTGLIYMLSGIAAMIPGAMVGVLGLGVIIAELALVLAAIGGLAQIPGLSWLIEQGGNFLQKIGTAIGQFIGGIIGGVALGATSTLPQVGANLSMFMMNLLPFIAGAKMIDSSVIDGVKSLVGVILAITGASIIEGITSWLTGGSSITKFADELPILGAGLKSFADSLQGADTNAIASAATAAKALAEMTSHIPNEGGMAAWFAGENSMAKWASQLPILGTGLKMFSMAIAGMDANAVTAAAGAAKAIAEMTSYIPNEGGMVAWFTGDNSIAKWAMQLYMLGDGLRMFSMAIAGMDANSITSASTAAKAIAEMTSYIPNEGGMSAWFAGDNSMAKWAHQLPVLGDGLRMFSMAITGVDLNSISLAAGAAKSLAEMTATIPNEGGIVAWFTGDNSVDKWADKLPILGAGMKAFSDTLNGVNIANLALATLAAKNLAQVTEIVPENTGYLETFGKNMVKFAKKVKEFVDKIGEVGSDGIASAINKTKELIDMAKTVANANIESLKTFGESLKTVAKDGVNGFVKEFSGNDPKSKAKEAVGEMVQSGIDGAEDKKSSVEDKFKSIAEAAVKALCTDKLLDSAKQAGKDLVIGFANGIKNNKSLASDAGSSIGQAALAAAKEAIDSHSPSKEAMKLGNFFGEGFVIGIQDYASTAYSESYSMADRAKSGLSQAISKVSDLINSDMDAQPTIRPVLDLSSVESGVGALNGMFNDGPSIGVMSNLRAISSGMNAKIQNGGNNDVVSAINKLSKNLGNTKGDTYNVNGITYDDGSNITDAVKTLVRAAKIERRV